MTICVVAWLFRSSHEGDTLLPYANMPAGLRRHPRSRVDGSFVMKARISVESRGNTKAEPVVEGIVEPARLR